MDSSFLGASSHYQPLEERVHTPSNEMLEHQSSQEAPAPNVPKIIEPTYVEPPRELTPPPPPMPAPVLTTAPEHRYVQERVPEPPVHHEPIAPIPPVAVMPAPIPPQPPIVQPDPIIITRENPINEELYAKYNQALAEVDHLQATLNNLQVKLKHAEERPAPVSELRRRTRRLSDADSAAGSDTMTMVDDAPMTQEGVPLNIVIAIALGVFVTTYVFF